MKQETQDTVTENLLPAEPAKQHGVARAVHWAVNFIGIGWVLNAVLSVEVFNAAKNYLSKNNPEFIRKSVQVTEQLFASVARTLKLNPSAAGLTGASKDFLEIVALGTGGFLVLPLQKLYAANHVRISGWIENACALIKAALPTKTIALQNRSPRKTRKASCTG